MIYPSDFESKIGFDVVRSSVAALCESEAGRRCVADMSFGSDHSSIKGKLLCVDEACSILTSSRDFPLDTIYNLDQPLAAVGVVGGFMSAEDLHFLQLTLENFAKVNSYFSTSYEDSSSRRYPWLASFYCGLPVFPDLIAEISKSIGAYGEVKDNASPELFEVRRAIRGAQGSIQRAMRRVLDTAVKEGFVDKDATPAIREGRMVIPVAAMMKRKISGIIHDESATGRTVYIEPAEVVEASNHLRELEMDERREITRILVSIADMIRPDVAEIKIGCQALGELDFIRAKAKYALEVGAQMPNLECKPEIDWYHAVHPGLLLSLRQHGREVVPMNLMLDAQHRILLISGPNAGGKSVTLKTVAIVQYMMQCGMLPTLYSNSHMGVFRKIMIDIGDQQSMENDLSTYSSHLLNMKFFVQNADSKSLVLADEMGSGTEPQIGGAIAQAILERLAQSGCFGIVTTHYQNLKSFADAREGLVNGAMLYDRQHLQPTFQLSVGSPGSSFALEIARKIGLPQDVIEQAKEIVGSDYVNIDKYLLDIARDRRYWNNKRLGIREKESKLENLLDKYEDEASDLRQRRNEIIRAAKAEAAEIIATANRTIEKAVRDIKEANAAKEATAKARKEVENLKNEMSKDSPSGGSALIPKVKRRKRDDNKEKTAAPSSVNRPKAVEVGDYVRMADGGVVGKVLAINGKKAEVAFGGLRTITELSRLTIASKPKESSAAQPSVLTSQTADDIRSRQLSFKNEIDVRGMRADEALQAVTYFIDDALQFNASRVRILHGTGHGILKTLIRQMLTANPGVTSFADEDVRFGGAGITVVQLG